MIEYKEELKFIEDYYNRVKGTEYIRDYAELAFFGSVTVSIFLCKDRIPKFNPKKEYYLLKASILVDGEKKLGITYIL